MANEQNLIPQAHTLTVEEASKGGKRSAEVRRENAMISKYINAWLATENTDKSGKTMTGAEAAALKLIQRFMRDGDLKAFELMRDTAGQKPVEKFIVADVEPSVIAEVEAMVNGSETGG